MLCFYFLAILVFDHDQILELEAKFGDSIVRLQSVFGTHGSLSAPDPDELIVIQVEFGAAPNDGEVVVISVQNPVILLGEQRNRLDFQFGRLIFCVISSIDDVAFDLVAVFPCRVEHDIVVLHVDHGNNCLAARVFASFIWVVISLNFEPCSEIFGEVEAFHNGRRRTTFEGQRSWKAQSQHQTIPRQSHLLVCVFLPSKQKERGIFCCR